MLGCSSVVLQDGKMPQIIAWDVIESKVLAVQTLVRGGHRYSPALLLSAYALCPHSQALILVVCQMRGGCYPTSLPYCFCRMPSSLFLALALPPAVCGTACG
jgi:hypothetical protein